MRTTSVRFVYELGFALIGYTLLASLKVSLFVESTLFCTVICSRKTKSCNDCVVDGIFPLYLYVMKKDKTYKTLIGLCDCKSKIILMDRG